MSWSYSVANDQGKVRLLCTDTNSLPDLQYFQDEEIQAFLDLEGSIRLAAALALETISSNEVLIQKVMKTLEVETDGSKVATALLQRAAALRKQDAMDFGGAQDFAIAEMVNNRWQANERWIKQWQRGVIP